MDLFVYGTLSSHSLLRSLTGCTFPDENARLRGFRRFEPAGSYPYILRCDGEVVEGRILRELDDSAICRLDRYEGEGDLYIRTEVIVETARGSHRCWAYVGNPLGISRLRIE
jgi:gamma-glutamylcyclotransferase (GGCT)/AIG2-like uncharacterized protein YtfP